MTKASITKLPADQIIKCGYPLCPFYSKDVTEMDCPMPIEGAACQGMGNPYEHYYGVDKPID